MSSWTRLKPMLTTVILWKNPLFFTGNVCFDKIKNKKKYQAFSDI